MPRFSNRRKFLLAVAVFGILGLAHGTANADPTSVCTGVGCSTTNVTGTIVAGNGTVTITLSNNLTNAQVVSVIQNISRCSRWFLPALCKEVRSKGACSRQPLSTEVKSPTGAFRFCRESLTRSYCNV